MHILHTNWAVLFERSYNAFVGVFVYILYTRTTGVTMKRLVSASNSTYSTLITVIYFFFISIVIEKIAYIAKIRSKLHIALFTIFLRFLDMLTQKTSDLSHSMPIHLMVLLWVHLILIFHLIMAQSA